jgi:hypothetical protein
MCSKGGIRLHKFVSNSKEVITVIPLDDRAKDIQDLNLRHDRLPVERALGVFWCVESDTFQFRITLKDQPATKRGVLSTINSVYDPLGFLAPLLLPGKLILQELCRQGDWDDPIPENIRARWDKWKRDILLLDSRRLDIQRCYQPKDFGVIKTIELHHFSDASTKGYGQCSYLRLVDDQHRVHCSLVMGKARVAPRKMTTIPRLELTAALVSVRVANMVKAELKYQQEIADIFWTDSKVVLGYISNETRRFHVFVANRVQQIRDKTEPSQWRYVKSNENPADEASRGVTATELMSKSKWLTGPDSLWRREIPLENNAEYDLSPEDPEVRRTIPLVTNVKRSPPYFQLERLEHLSDWTKAKRAVANCLKLKTLLQNKVKNGKDIEVPPLSTTSVHAAELEIIKAVQAEAFPQELKVLSSMKVNEEVPERGRARKRNHAMKVTSSLYRLDPFLDENGIMRVGGRLRRAEFSTAFKHPVILPRRHHVTELVIRYFHARSQHQGRGLTTNAIRANGYWILGCSAAVSNLISKCVRCKRLRSKTLDQKMSDLPSDRVQPAPPFTYCAIDFLGHFTSEKVEVIERNTASYSPACHLVLYTP